MFLVAATLVSLAAAGVLIRSHPDEWAPGKEGTYIVIFEDHATDAQKASLTKVSIAAGLHTKRAPRRIEFGRFSALAGHLEDSKLEEISKLPFVKMVTMNKIVRKMDFMRRPWATLKPSDEVCLIQRKATWGLDRITERDIQLDGDFVHSDLWGQGVTAYIVDTGIFIEHDEFEGRAEWGANFADDRKNKDCNGHGTHVAGTIGGKTYGIARNATLVAVKVLNCEGSGSYDSVMSGIEFVARDAKKRGTASVLNMSLGGPKDPALDEVVRAAVKEGVVVVVAGGNENTDACNGSPSGVAEAITVAASEVFTDHSEHDAEQDGRASFSNYGPCIDVIAPGARITSSWIGERNSVKTISGTSMASPHVAGVVATMLSRNSTASPEDIKAALIDMSTKDLVQLKCGSSSSCKKTPNRLLYVECGDSKRK